MHREANLTLPYKGQKSMYEHPKIRKENNSVIIHDIITVLELCTSSDGHLSMYQVSFNSLLYFQRYAPHKLFIAKN